MMEHLITYAIQMVGGSDFNLKLEQLACTKYLCEGRSRCTRCCTVRDRWQHRPYSDSVVMYSIFSLIPLMIDQVWSLRSWNNYVSTAILSSGGKELGLIFKWVCVVIDWTWSLRTVRHIRREFMGHLVSASWCQCYSYGRSHGHHC